MGSGKWEVGSRKYEVRRGERHSQGANRPGMDDFPLPTSYFPLPTPYSLLLTPHFLLPTSYFLLPTSYFLLPTPYFLGADRAGMDDAKGVDREGLPIWRRWNWRLSHAPNSRVSRCRLAVT